MSPEQAAGEPFVTAAADVYSLACVLYEVLVGEPPFDGHTPQAILGKILTGEAPAASTRRKTVPVNVDAAIARAMEKVPADRFGSAKAFGAALTDPAFRHGSGGRGVDAAGGRWRQAALIAAGAFVVASALAAVGWMRPDEPRPVNRYALAQDPEERIGVVFGPSVAVAPDGSSIAYIVGQDADQGGKTIWLKERDAAHARAIPGTEGAQQLFFLDSRTVGFLTEDLPEPRAVKAASLETGEVVTLVSEGFFRNGASAGPDGAVYLNVPNDPSGGRIASFTHSGKWEAVTTPAEGEQNHLYPHASPGGEGLLFNIQYGSYQLEYADVAVVDLSTGEHRTLIENAVMPRYAASGHVIAVRSDGTLLAAPFDEKRLVLTGPVVPLFSDVGIGLTRSQTYGVDLDLSREGTLVYVSGSRIPDEARKTLEWIDRDGGRRSVALDWAADFESVALSPDGRLMAVTVGSHDSTGVWLMDLESGSRSALTFSTGLNRRPSWSADGREVFFISDRSGRRAAYSRRVDGTGEAELLLGIDGVDVDEVEVSPDGRWIVYRTGTTAGDRDIWALRRGADPSEAIAVSARQDGIDEVSPTLSPDGRYVAYTSYELGEPVVWVRTFPDPSGGRWRISACRRRLPASSSSWRTSSRS